MARSARKVVDKRTAIVDAAVTLFARQGFHGTTVPEIAALAGVATGSIYLYFATKEALVNAAFVERKRAMLDALLAASSAGGDFGTRFRRAWRQLVAFAVAHPDDFRFFELHHHESYLDPASRAVGERLMGAAVTFMREIKDAHRIASPSAEVMVSLVWGALVGLLKAADQNFIRLEPQLVEAAGLVLWHGVTSAAAATPASNDLQSPRHERRTP